MDIFFDILLAVVAIGLLGWALPYLISFVVTIIGCALCILGLIFVGLEKVIKMIRGK